MAAKSVSMSVSMADELIISSIIEGALTLTECEGREQGTLRGRGVEELLEFSAESWLYQWDAYRIEANSFTDDVHRIIVSVLSSPLA
jgi:hypothetical protein